MPILDKNGKEFSVGVKPVKEIKPTIIQEIKPKPEIPKLPYKLITLNCLPVQSNIYQKPIKVDAFISKSTDLTFECWSQNKLEIGSVLHQMTERRWWEIKEIKEDRGWYNYSCLPSDICPNFA